MSKRIAILSDTHNLLRQDILEGIRGCDAILHAGDICSEEIMDQLRAAGPVYVVRGNNDFGWASSLSRSLVFQLEDLKFGMIHDKRYLSKELREVDILIHGHTHQYDATWVGEQFQFNPGSAGRPRYTNELTYAIMTLDGRDFSIEKRTLIPEKRRGFFW
ncbi:MAG: metallophosphoesterase family protein [Lachnospiraceae bacterium]|nr:metallophosphoesterase family protein [Lachnospiraceae bacterium]